VQLVNARNERVVATKVEIAESRSARRRGLLGRAGLADGAALVLTPCCAVHTIGMRFPIDVVFVDSRGLVRKIVRALGPRKIAIAFGASAVVELAAHALSPAETLSIGDRLYLAPETAESEERAGAGAAAIPGTRFGASRRTTAANPACSGS
jgi:uncharacterized membrane protein (UPF0127 family)